MHTLDLIIYFVGFGIIWFFLDILSCGEWTNELGGALVGLPIIIVYTIIYVILFVLIDYNWIDIFHAISLNLKW